MNIENVHAYAAVGHSHDCGNKLGYTQTFIEVALRHPDIGPQVAEFIKNIAKTL